MARVVTSQPSSNSLPSYKEAMGLHDPPPYSEVTGSPIVPIGDFHNDEYEDSEIDDRRRSSEDFCCYGFDCCLRFCRLLGDCCQCLYECTDVCFELCSECIISSCSEESEVGNNSRRRSFITTNTLTPNNNSSYDTLQYDWLRFVENPDPSNDGIPDSQSCCDTTVNDCGNAAGDSGDCGGGDSGNCGGDSGGGYTGGDCGGCDD